MRTSLLRFSLLFPVIALAGCGGSSSTVPGTGGHGIVGSVSTVAGASQFGTTDGVGGAARFHNPVKCAVAANGNVFVSDFDNSAVRMVTPAGAVSTVTFGQNFQLPFGMTIASDGTLYVQTDNDDFGAHSASTGTVWKIDQATGTPTFVARDSGRPRGLLALRDGRLALSDLANYTVSLMDASTGAVTPLAGTAGTPGFNNAA